MKVLLTGGAGFIGSHIAEKLLKENYEVIIVDNLITGQKENIPDDVKFYEADVRKSIDYIFINEQPDYVIHQAAQVSVAKSIDTPFYDGEENILATINLLEACVKYKIKKFIFASTAAAYGNPKYLPIDENHTIQPISFYGLSKCTAETYIKIFSSLYGLPYTILRYANVYGMRQSTNGEAGVIAVFTERFLKYQTPLIFGDGQQTRDYVFVKDVAKANVAAIKKGDNETINISTNTQTTLLTIVTELTNILNINLIPNFCGPREGDIIHSYLSNEKSKKVLQWEPTYSVRMGLKETVAFYEENLIKKSIKYDGY